MADASDKELHALYEECLKRPIPIEDLFSTNGYNPENEHNLGGAVHMIQRNNTLEAAIVLAAQASVVRTEPEDGSVIEDSARLIDCGVGAEKVRNSDPTITAKVNELARHGAFVSLADPLGLYIDDLFGAQEWELPTSFDNESGLLADAFWTVTRGDSGFGVRAVYEVPEKLGFRVSDIRISGTPISSPSQIAEHVLVRLTGLASGTGHVTARKCREDIPGGLESLEIAPEMSTRVMA